jgi:hypothetical protein
MRSSERNSNHLLNADKSNAMSILPVESLSSIDHCGSKNNYGSSSLEQSLTMSQSSLYNNNNNCMGQIKEELIKESPNGNKLENEL